MAGATWQVRELSPEEWRLLRRVRRQALDDSPHAFLSRHHEESWGEWDWRQTFDGARWFVAQADEIIGLLRSVRHPTEPWSSRHVESIWVAPAYRKQGVFRSMLFAVAERERKTGARDLMLWVLEDNHGARQVYQRLGFEPIGEPQRLPDEADRCERRLVLAITDLLSV